MMCKNGCCNKGSSIKLSNLIMAKGQMTENEQKNFIFFNFILTFCTKIYTNHKINSEVLFPVSCSGAFSTTTDFSNVKKKFVIFLSLN